jgi:hypothetical protein
VPAGEFILLVVNAVPLMWIQQYPPINDSAWKAITVSLMTIFRNLPTKD